MPFDDNFFDFVFSHTVFEHVQNYSETLSEIHRVLKPGGTSLHIFPSRYRFIESHVYIPLASIIQQHGWLMLWAKLGIRNEHQKGMSAKQIASNNYNYLKNHTTYYTNFQIISYVRENFNEFKFCELIAVKYSRMGSWYFILKRLPFASQFINTFYTKILFFKKNEQYETN